jgi:hypothetical protein
MRCPKATLASLLRSCPPGVRFSTRAGVMGESLERLHRNEIDIY